MPNQYTANNDHEDFRGIWERNGAGVEETDLQYRRFREYLMMKDRNITELAHIYGIRDGGLRTIAAAKKWTERAQAYDRFVTTELDRAAISGTLISIDGDKQRRDEFIEQYEAMRLELWEVRKQLLTKVKKMMNFEVGNTTKSVRKVYRAKNPATKQLELNVVNETVTDPRWSWGDAAKMLDVVDRIGNELLNLSPDVLKEMPAFCYELRRNGYDVADFMRRTVDKLRAS